MKALKGIKLSKEKDKWLIKNAVKSKRIVAEKLEVSLTPKISSPA